ncbi:MAG: hypothetical protein V7L29_00530 [Nostoc sp.]
MTSPYTDLYYPRIVSNGFAKTYPLNSPLEYSDRSFYMAKIIYFA